MKAPLEFIRRQWLSVSGGHRLHLAEDRKRVVWGKSDSGRGVGGVDKSKREVRGA